MHGYEEMGHMEEEKEEHEPEIPYYIPHQVNTYELNTVTYGTTSAQYLATRTPKQIITDKGGKFPLAAPVVETDFYVDDLVTGVNNEATAVELQRQLIKLFDAGGMKLHKWSSNTRRLGFCFDKDKENIKTLGLKWN
ncbi:hypothetical protein AVEN_189048-1 [Araneus ventricosus]|uniref:Uncharacterized protein n=1 Tax=Araneus ventricosus TaxID=182803 RepID=A0A4Y2SBH6_ARAVE|nr:hypothetical protein AVEN_189048-1 [Araneus ventricosus]